MAQTPLNANGKVAEKKNVCSIPILNTTRGVLLNTSDEGFLYWVFSDPLFVLDDGLFGLFLLRVCLCLAFTLLGMKR